MPKLDEVKLWDLEAEPLLHFGVAKQGLTNQLMDKSKETTEGRLQEDNG